MSKIARRMSDVGKNLEVKMRAPKMTSDGRASTITLLDGRSIALNITARLQCVELYELIASHCRLRPPDLVLFGVVYGETQDADDDEADEFWLPTGTEACKRVLDVVPQNKKTKLLLRHQVKYFVHPIVTSVAHTSTIELIYHQCRRQLLQGDVHVLDHGDLRKCIACILHVYHGDCLTDELTMAAVEQLKIPSRRFLRHAVDGEFAQRVLQEYTAMDGCSRGEALLRFISIVSTSPTYGMRYWAAVDKAGAPVLLGVSSRGIFVFDVANESKVVMRWSALENLFYKDKKFSVEIHDEHRSTGLSKHIYSCLSAQSCKCLWQYAIDQHTFSLDRSNKHFTRQSSSSTANLARALTSSLTSESSCSSLQSLSLPRMSAATCSMSSLSQPSIKSHMSTEDRQRNMHSYGQLKLTKTELERQLVEKMAELKLICVEEGNVTGELPSEMTKALSVGEKPPKCQTRVGTSFSYDTHMFAVHSRHKMNTLEQLQEDIDVHRHIVAASHRLANGKANKSIRKSRQKQFELALRRQKELEAQMVYMRHGESQPDLTVYDVDLQKTPRNVTKRSRSTTPWSRLLSHSIVSPVKHSIGAHRSLKSTTKADGGGMKSAPTTPHGSTHNLMGQTLPLYQCRNLMNAADLPPPAPRRKTSAPAQRAVRTDKSRLPVYSLSPCLEDMSGSGSMTRYRTVSGGADRANDTSILLPSPPAVFDDDNDHGYAPIRQYQNSYRRNNFPTLVNHAPPTTTTNKENSIGQRTYSEHSLHSLGHWSPESDGVRIDTRSTGGMTPSSSQSSSLAQRASTSSSQGSTQHLHAYNVQQRSTSHAQTSDYGSNSNCHLNEVDGGADGGGRSPQHYLPIMRSQHSGVSLNTSAGSLDRQLIRARQRMMQQKQHMSSESHMMSHAKPFETVDAMRYHSARISPPRSSTLNSSLSRTISPLAGTQHRRPPPPYNGSPQHLAVVNRQQTTPKKATIV